MRILTSRAIATAAAAAIALTTMGFQPAAAGTRGDDAAAAFIFAGVLGTIAALIATQSYDDHPHYSYGPVRGPGFGGHGYGAYRGHGHGPHGWQMYRHR
jgi:hypothetical protein